MVLFKRKKKKRKDIAQLLIFDELISISAIIIRNMFVSKLIPGGVRPIPSLLNALPVAVQQRAMASKATFNWEDPFDFNGMLTEEERAIRDGVRSYSQDKLMPRILEVCCEGVSFVVVEADRYFETRPIETKCSTKKSIRKWANWECWVLQFKVMVALV